MPEDLSDVITIGPYEPGDETSILDTFNRVFDQNRTLAEWNWEFRDNPAGLHAFLAKLPDGKVISQFCGIPRRMVVKDREVIFAEIVDSLTDRQYRRGLKKPGLFATTCYKFVDHHGRPDREIIMYGLPNPPAFRVGKLLLGYEFLYQIQFLTRAVESATAGDTDALADGMGTGREVDVFAEDTLDLYHRFQKAHQVMTIRDPLYLNWRYNRPDVPYGKYEFRDPAGTLFGIAALRHGWRDPPVTVMCEWMVDIEHPSAPAALARMEACARHAGSERIQVVVQPGAPMFQAFQKAGYHPEDTEFPFVARTYDREFLPLDFLRENWFISFGDFDIV